MGMHVGPPTKRAMTLTGYYTGNGGDNRDIDIGVNLAGKRDVYVMIKMITNQNYAIFRTDWGQGDGSVIFATDAGVEANEIQGFTATGFQVGSGIRVNQAAKVYAYHVTWGEG